MFGMVDKARRGCRRHVPAPPSSATTLSMMYHYRSISCGGTPALVGHCRPVVACKAVSTIDVATRARWRRRHLRQGCLRCTSTRCRHSAGRAQMSHNVDSSRRVVQCRPSTSLLVHGGAAADCAKVAYDVPVLAVVVWRDERRCLTMSTRRGSRCSVDQRSRRPCAVAPPSRAPRLPMMYQYLLLLFGGTSAHAGQCRPVEARDSVSTIDLAARARWHRRRVRQGYLRCTSARCGGMADRAQMFDNVDSSRRATRCRPSMSPPVRGGAAFVCAKVAYDVPVLAVVVWRDERRCRTMSTRRGAQWTTDHRPRCPCTMAPPSCAPRLPMMYQCSLWWNGGPRADVGQCRLVEARCAVSTIDLAARARWHRRRVRQGCLRCTSARCGGMADRAQMFDNVDSSRRATRCRPSMSPPVRGGAAFVCAKVAYDVPVLAVVVWRDERRRRTMSTRRGALRGVDHQPRCSCTVAPPSCAPRLPMMYQCSLWWNGGPRADVGQCRLVEARCAVSTIDLAARARWRRRRVRQGCPRCTSARCYCLVGRAQMFDNADSSRRVTPCRLAISPSVCAGSAERLKCMITHMVASNETI
jgi:hypothetical protein